MNQEMNPRIPFQCSLCGSNIDKGPGAWVSGHNAEPLPTTVLPENQTAYMLPGRCCSACNDTKVIPERMRQAIINYKEAQTSNQGLIEAIVKLETADAEYEARIKRLEEEGKAP